MHLKLKKVNYKKRQKLNENENFMIKKNCKTRDKTCIFKIQKNKKKFISRESGIQEKKNTVKGSPYCGFKSKVNLLTGYDEYIRMTNYRRLQWGQRYSSPRKFVIIS